MEDKQLYTLYRYDMLPYDDGWIANNRRYVANGVEITDEMTNADILKKCGKLFNAAGIELKDCSVHGDDGIIYIDDKNGEPLCELVRSELTAGM